jgi:hypothetical protein
MSPDDGERRLRAATRTFKLLLVGMIVAIATPLFLHYTGITPAEKLGGLGYPHVHNYKLRLTPGQGVDHGIDFSQIWLSARRWSADQPVYYPVEKQTWRREWSSTYHPLIHWLYVPAGKLAFRTALVLHNLLGIGLMLGCCWLALRQAKCQTAFPSVAALTVAAMYLSPTGLLHLERGQMDTYVAATMLCTVALFRTGGRGWAIAAGFLSMMKVQAWIFVGFYSFVAAPLFGLRERNLWWVPLTIAAGTLVFWSQLGEWLPSFLYVADNTSTHGATFTRILPKFAAYGLPLATSAVVGLACFLGLRDANSLADVSARRRLLERVAFPLAAALAVQTVCGTSVTHDYRLVAFLGLLPALCAWCVHATGVSTSLRNAASLAFGALLWAALRVPPLRTLSYEETAYCLLTLSLFFAGVAAYLGSDARGIEAPEPVAPASEADAS